MRFLLLLPILTRMKAFCDGGGIDEVALADLARDVAVDALQLDFPLHREAMKKRWSCCLN